MNIFSDAELPELDWQAFRYIAGEMPADEVEAFEAQLANDQPAREAVARMVLVVQSAMAAEAPVATVTVKPQAVRATGKRASAAVVAASAVCVLLALGVLFFGQTFPRGSVVKVDHAGGGHSADGAQRLISLWAQGEADRWLDDGYAASSAGGPVDELSEFGGSGLTAPVVVPGWMLAAVSIEKEARSADPARPDDEIREN